MGRIKVLTAMAVLGVALLVANSAQALVLTNFNTDVTLGPGNSTITQWTVDGVNQYIGGTGAWYYRVGAGPIINLSTIFVANTPVTGPIPGDPFDFSPTTVTSTYADAGNGLAFTLKYVVIGGDPGTPVSTIQAQLTAALIGPSTGTALTIFEFNNLAVNNNEINDIVMPSLLNAGGKVNQSDPNTVFGESATSKVTGNGSTAVSDPSRREAGFTPNVTTDLFVNGLLNNAPPAGVSVGPGDVAYAYQYNYILASGSPSQSAEIDIQRNLSAAPAVPPGAVPEPVSAMLSLLGLAVLGSLTAGRRSKLA